MARITSISPALLLLAALWACAHKDAATSPKAGPPSDESQPKTSARADPDPKAHTSPPGEVSIHFGEEWFAFRAKKLSIAAEEAKRRDAASFSENGPKERFWDEQTAVEAASIWTAVCNECHEGARKIEDATEIPAPPKAWGRSSGYFFGRMKSHKDVYEIIRDGLPFIDGRGPKENMPAWGRKLAREQIWSLVYWLEYQSRPGAKGRRK